jgi:CRP/FNR family transcriptional regulator, cyclic AMP receptor protein
MDESRLASIPLFASLSRDECRGVARFADEVDLPEGKTLMREGDWAYEFFAIENGGAEVRRGDERIAELGPGDFFGEMGLMDHIQRNASVITTSSMTAIVMTGPQFRQAARELPGVADRIRAAIEERSRSLAERT